MGKLPFFIYVIRILLALGLLVAAWFFACQQRPAANKAGQPPETQPSSRHTSGKVHFDLLAKLLADDRRGDPADPWLQELADPGGPFQVRTQPHPLLNQAAPDFVLQDHDGRSRSLQSQLAHGPVLLVFYLGYACDRCVANLFELNADLEHFHALEAEVLAISGDSVALTQRRFAEYGAFGSPLLSDPGHGVARLYGTFVPATSSKSEKLLHGAFLIGRDGRVTWAHIGDTPFHGNRALLYEVARSEKKLPQSKPSHQPAIHTQEES
jgi:thioredoxin-dependent peroxiredoxin